MHDPDRFPFTVAPSDRWPGWQCLLFRQFGQTFVVGWYRYPDDEAKLAKELRKCRAIWAQTVERRQKIRAAVAALQQERTQE